MCSDHFHPWSERQGQSGFAWSWLGAALEATRLSFGTVCAPGQRYHPAVIAQAAATLSEMFPGRFWLAVGSGENLNEHITGDPWPSDAERDARLKECIDVMRKLWRGETVTHRGLIQVDRAKLYSRPAEPPKLLGAALTAETAAMLAGWADGLITAGHEARSILEVVSAFRRGGGQDKPVLVQAALSYAPTEEEALAAAYDQWRHCLVTDRIADLATPAEFDAACAGARPEDLRGKLAISADLQWNVEWLTALMELDVDAIYLNHIGRNVPRFIDAFAEQVLPRLPGSKGPGVGSR
jgi:probable non-F420 flavinoid oxidoreductase